MIEFTDSELLHLAGASLSIHQRVARAKINNLQLKKSSESIDCLERWIYSVSQNSTDVFFQRIQKDSLLADADLELTLGLIEQLELNESDHAMLLWHRDAFSDESVESAYTSDWSDSICGIPFSKLILPYVNTAKTRVSTHVLWDQLDHQCHQALLGKLAHELSWIISPTLYQEFDSFRNAHYSNGNVYENFALFFRENSKQYLLAYPVIARMLAVRATYWLQAVHLMLDRISQDKEFIESRFRIKNGLGVTEIHVPWSDPHCKGQFVAILTYSDNRKIAYKPRPAAIGLHYENLSRWLNQEFGLSIGVVQTLDCGEYGYTEFCDATSIERPNEYCYRCGSLLFVLYLLAGTDCHFENVISSHGFPCLVDTETLLSPSTYLGEISRPQAEQLVNEKIRRSVLSTGFLPGWSAIPGRKGVADLSGYHCMVSSQSDNSSPLFWKNLNSDSMTLEDWPDFTPTSQRHAYSTSDKEIASVVRGFQDLYMFVMSCYTNQSDPIHEILSDFNGVCARVVVRPTNIYWRLLISSLSGDSARCGIERSIVLERLWLPFYASTPPDYVAEVVAEEIQSLLEGDIPYFTHNTADGYIQSGTNGLKFKAFGKPAYTQLIDRLTLLSADDCRFQTSCINTSFLSVQAGASDDLHVATPGIAQNGSSMFLFESLSRKHLDAISNHISSRLITGEDGSISWIGFDYDVMSQSFRMKGLDPISIYSGGGGIAVYLAAYGVTHGSSRHVELALTLVMRIADLLLDEHRRPMQLGGAFVGFMSGIHTLSIVGEILNNQHILDLAYEASLKLNQQLVMQDSSFDVISGSAGSMLVIRRLLRHFQCAELKDKMSWMADHLINRHHDSYLGGAIWPNVSISGTFGFAHGNSGIALALASAFQITKSDRYRTIITEALKFESSFFDPDAADWKDNRAKSNDKSFAGTWCYGSPGVALSRLGILSILGLESAGLDLDYALAACLKYSLKSEHACCGNAGIADLFMVVSKYFKDDRWVVQAMNRLTGAVSSLPLELTVGHGITEAANILGFMQGISGYGYSLLRIINPNLPSVLACGADLCSTEL